MPAQELNSSPPSIAIKIEVSPTDTFTRKPWISSCVTDDSCSSSLKTARREYAPVEHHEHELKGHEAGAVDRHKERYLGGLYYLFAEAQ